MSIKSLLNSLSTALRANDNKSLYPLFSQDDFSGLNPNSNGMTLENMINAILAYLERYNIILRHKLHSSSNDVDTTLEINYDIPFISNTNGAIGLFAFEDRLTKLSCSELTTIPPYFCACSNSIQEIDFPKVTTIYSGAFSICKLLQTVNLPSLTTIKMSSFTAPPTLSSGVFARCSNLVNLSLPKLLYNNDSQMCYGCSSLVTVDLPVFTGQGNSYDTSGSTTSYFASCSKLTNVNVPKMLYVNNSCFSYCSSLIKLKLPSVVKIDSSAFNGCSKLIALVIDKTTPPELTNINAFSNTPIRTGTGYIYVPDSVVDTYKAATNWSSFADQIKPISEYTEG